MSGLYKRGDVYWYDFRFNGKRYRQSTGKVKRREAEDEYDKKKGEIKDGKCLESKKNNDSRFYELTERYLKWAESRKSYRDKKSLVSQLERWFGDIKVNILDYREVDLFLSECMKRRSPATTNRYMSCLKHMLAKGVKWKMVHEHVLNEVRDVKQLRENNKRLRYLTVEESGILINCCNDDLRPIVITALNTGMRRGEILNLKWSQIDLKNGFILLENTKNGERREIPINQTLRDVFLSLTRCFDDSNVFFSPKTDKPVKCIKRRFTKACEKAKLQNFRFHDLRHSFASFLIMRGVDIKTVQELLGHKSLTMTLRYSHLAPGHKKNAVSVLDEMVDNEHSKDFGYNLGTITDKYQKLTATGSK